MKHLYFDNSVAMEMTDNPKSWNKIYNEYAVTEFGRTVKYISSWYLFLEYVGFRKKHLGLPAISCNFKDVLDLLKVNSSEDNIHLLDEKLLKIFDERYEFIKEKLLSDNVKYDLKKLINERIVRINNWEWSLEFKTFLFDYFFHLFEEDYICFAEILADYLAWDEFCNIPMEGLSIEKQTILLERLLAFWYQHWEKGYVFPFGKITDDLSHCFKMSFNPKSRFRNKEDMVDSEIITLAIMGHKTEAEEVHPINILTFDNPVRLKERLSIASGCIFNIETTLKKTLKKFPGTIYCLDRNSFEYKEKIVIHVPILL